MSDRLRVLVVPKWYPWPDRPVFGSGDVLYHLPLGATEPVKRSFPEVDTFTAEIEHFANCLREGKRPIHGVAEGRAVLELILKASQSADGWQQTAVKKM